MNSNLVISNLESLYKADAELNLQSWMKFMKLSIEKG